MAQQTDLRPWIPLGKHKRPKRKLTGFWARVSDCAFNALSGEGCHSDRTDWEERPTNRSHPHFNLRRRI